MRMTISDLSWLKQYTPWILQLSIFAVRFFPGRGFGRPKAELKLHTLLDLRGNIPTFVSITEAKVHDVNILDELIIEPGAIYVMDRGYLDFFRLYRLHRACHFSF